MWSQFSWKAALATVALAGAVTFHAFADEIHPPPASRTFDDDDGDGSGKSFMHAKLAATHQIVDGLAFEDFSRIEGGADELLRMTELASWKVRQDPLYMHYSADFESISLRLRAAARARSIEKATFAYMHLTVSCTACHQHVRDVVQIAPAPDATAQPTGQTVFR